MSNSLAATLLLAVWIISPLLAVVHVALEEHSYCAEHQRLEESASAHASIDDLAKTIADTLASGPGSPAQLSEAQPDEALDAHGACAFADDFRRDDCTLEFGVCAKPAPLAWARHAIPIASSAESSIPLLRVAPKNSPPLAV